VGRDLGGNAVFAVSINSSTGVVSVAQWESIQHPTPGGSYDESVNLGGAVNAVVTVTDGDGDIATQSVGIGSQIRFDSIDELLVQMKADVDGARRILTGN